MIYNDLFSTYIDLHTNYIQCKIIFCFVFLEGASQTSWGLPDPCFGCTFNKIFVPFFSKEDSKHGRDRKEKYE